MMSVTHEWYVAEGDRYRLLEAKIASPLVAIAIEQLVGPYAWATLAALRSPHRATATVMAVTACRWGELEDIQLGLLFAGWKIQWTPTKGSALRSAQLPIDAAASRSDPLSIYTPPHVVQYPCHAAAVRQAARSVGLEPSGASCKATHVWRHLRAWHMLDQGHTLYDIASALGHRRPDSTEYYTRSMPAKVRELIHS